MQNKSQKNRETGSLVSLGAQVSDGENNPVSYDIGYTVKQGLLPETIARIKQLHGPSVYLLPLSGASGGGGIFQVAAPAEGTIVGLQIAPTSEPRTKIGTVSDLTTLSLNQIVIDVDQMRIYAGAAITLEQLNQALEEYIGIQHKVLGADLTSYTYAQVGATFMTGGMGPQRRYFSDSVTDIALHNGETVESISGEALSGYAGTYGWTGVVTAVCCQYHVLPDHEIAFAIPISNAPDRLSKLIASLAKLTYLKLDRGSVLTVNGKTDLITGVEHVTTTSMDPMFERDVNNSITRRAKVLRQKCLAANVDGLLFVSGFSNQSIDEFVVELIDDQGADTPTIGGISLEHTEIFKDPNEMRAIREAIPYAARTQAPDGQYVFKDHTDATIRLHPDWVESAMSVLWQANQDYVNSIQEFFYENPSVQGQILVYGHLNPYGVDPHNRITMACDAHSDYQGAVAFLDQQRQNFYQALRDLCDDTGSIFVGGEKGAGSEREILPALGGPENAPPALARKFQRQQSAIQSALGLLNWRALPPYLNTKI